MQFINPWRMPMLFLISGIGVWFALGQRSGPAFLKERIQRLLIPFVFGLLVVLPPQWYFEMLERNTLTVSYLEFYVNHLTHLRLDRWGHLWFIAYLFVFVLVATPLFLSIRQGAARKMTHRLAGFLTDHPLSPWLLVFPLFIIEWSLASNMPYKRDFIHDAYQTVFYFTTFLYGFFIASTEVLWEVLERQRRWSLLIGLLCFTGLTAVWISSGQSDLQRPHSDSVFVRFIWSANVMAWIFCCIGYARRYLNMQNRLLAYANRATLPFYLLHQPILIGIGYLVVQLNAAAFEKYLILLISTILVTSMLYELLIRRIRFMHVFFGLKNTTDTGTSKKAARVGRP